MQAYNAAGNSPNWSYWADATIPIPTVGITVVGGVPAVNEGQSFTVQVMWAGGISGPEITVPLQISNGTGYLSAISGLPNNVEFADGTRGMKRGRT